MIDFENKEAFNIDSLDKQIRLTVDGIQYRNDKIRDESMEVHESICESNTLEFGCCEASSIKLDVSREIPSLVGKMIKIDLLVGSWFPIGTYIVVSEKPSNTTAYKTIVAYDGMYMLASKDVTEWFKSIPAIGYFKSLRESFFEYLGIGTEEVDLINDSEFYAIDQDVETMSALEVMQSICELNGVYGNIDRNGVFRFLSLPSIEKSELYPSALLFPSSDLFPSDYTHGADGLNPSLFSSVKYEEYEVQKITKVTAQTQDHMAAVGEDGNTYAVRHPLLLQGMTFGYAYDICNNLLQKIKDIHYRPISKLIAKGNPCLEVGDVVKVYLPDDGIFVDTYILSRTLKGISSLEDTYSSKGTEYQPEIKPQTARDTSRTATERIDKLAAQTLKIVWVSSESQVGSDPYTFYCIEK